MPTDLSAVPTFCVKNTFIEVPDEEEVAAECAPRRAGSAPPSKCYGRRASCGSADSDSEASTADTASCRTPASSFDAASCFQPVVVAFPPGPSPLSTFPSVYQTADVCVPCFPAGYTIAIPASPPGSPRRGAEDWAEASFAEDSQNDETQAWQDPGKTALCSRARMWKPERERASKKPEMSFPLPIEAWSRFAQVVMVGRVVLAQCEFITGLRSSEGEQGCMLSGAFHARHLEAVHAAFLHAMQVIVEAADESADVYVMGYDNKPWAPSKSPVLHRGLGVTAKLAVVTNEHAACWDLLGHGSCKYGAACRWTHPIWQVPVNIILNITEEDLPR